MKIADGIFRIDGVRGNAYVVHREKMVVIDTGMPGSGPKIVDFIQNSLKEDVHNVSTIVLTHQHIDHAGSALWLKNATGARIAIHEEDADYVSGRRKPLRPKGATGVLFSLFSPFFKLRTFEPDILLKEGDGIDGFGIMHIPGHTPGSIAIFDRAKEFAFSGDIISGRSSGVEYAPSNFNNDDTLMKKSYASLVSMDFALLFPGHGDPVSRADARALLEKSGGIASDATGAKPE
jgi:glyoxylase-like metal-dependent hydrolase (beta-lactamase superfamily II)